MNQLIYGQACITDTANTVAVHPVPDDEVRDYLTQSRLEVKKRVLK